MSTLGSLNLMALTGFALHSAVMLYICVSVTDLLVYRRGTCLYFILVAMADNIASYSFQNTVSGSHSWEEGILMLFLFFLKLLFLKTVWRDSMLKIFLASIIGEITAFFCMVWIVLGYNYIKYGQFSTNVDYRAGLKLCVPFAAGMLLIYGVARYFLKTVCMRFRDYQIRHPILWGIVLAFYIVNAFASRLEVDFNSAETYKALFSRVLYATTPLILILIGTVLVYRHRLAWKREYLEREAELAMEEYHTLQDQITHLNQNRAEVEQSIQQFHQMEHVDSDRIREYLTYLQGEYEKLSTGMYSDDFLIDAIFSQGKQQCDASDIHAVFSAQEYHPEFLKPGGDIGPVLLLLMDHGIIRLKEAQISEKRLSLKIATVKNYTMIKLDYSRTGNGEWTRFSLRNNVERQGGKFHYRVTGDQVEITVMI